MSAQHVRRASLGSLAAAVPVLIEIALSSMWWDRLPERIATTFGPDGSADGYGTPLGTVSLVAAVQTPFLIAAVGSAFARDRRKGRIACAVTAGFIATVAISWLIIAGVAASTVAPAAWWAILAGPAWAVVPYWLLRPDTEAA